MFATFVPFGRFETSAPVALNRGDPFFFVMLISMGHEPNDSFAPLERFHPL